MTSYHTYDDPVTYATSASCAFKNRKGFISGKAYSIHLDFICTRICYNLYNLAVLVARFLVSSIYRHAFTNFNWGHV
jgi:hypothetical protein